jgi:serine/threonine protein kinase
LIAAKTSKTPIHAEFIRWEVFILKTFKHPLILKYQRDISETPDHNSVIVTEFAGNESLAGHFPLSEFSFSGAKMMTRVVVGFVLAMRFVHSRDVIHRDLNADNVLFDWNWNVRIADFVHIISPHNPNPLSRFQFNANPICLFRDSQCLEPE